MFYMFISNFTLVSIIQTLYFKTCGYSFYQIGILLSFLQIGKWIFEIPTGIIADKYGKKRSVICSCLCIVLSYILCLLTKNYYVFILSMIVFAIGYTFESGALISLFVETCEKYDYSNKLAKLDSINRIFFYIAYGVSSVVAGFVAAISYELVYVINIVILIIGLIVLLPVKEEKNSEAHSEMSSKKMVNDLSFLKKNQVLKYLYAVEISISLAMIPISAYYTNYLVDTMQLEISSVGVIIFIQFIFSSLIGMFVTRKETMLNAERIVISSPFLLLVAFLGFFTFDNRFLALLSYFIGLTIFCCYAPFRYKKEQKQYQNDNRATLLSIKSLFLALFASVTQPVIGYGMDVVGMKAMFMVFMLISLGSLVIVNVNNYNHLKQGTSE